MQRTIAASALLARVSTASHIAQSSYRRSIVTHSREQLPEVGQGNRRPERNVQPLYVRGDICTLRSKGEDRRGRVTDVPRSGARRRNKPNEKEDEDVVS